MPDPRDELAYADLANEPGFLPPREPLRIRVSPYDTPPPSDTGWGGVGAGGRPTGRLFEPDQTPGPEEQFQQGIRATPWFSEFVARHGEEPDLNTPDYDYRKAWAAGSRPDVRDPGDNMLHWSSQFKGENHPNRFVNGVDTITGQPQAGLPRPSMVDALRTQNPLADTRPGLPSLGESLQALPGKIGSLVSGAGAYLNQPLQQAPPRAPADPTAGPRGIWQGGYPSPQQPTLLQRGVTEGLNIPWRAVEESKGQFDPTSDYREEDARRARQVGAVTDVTGNLAGFGMAGSSIRGGASAGAFGGGLRNTRAAKMLDDPEYGKLPHITERYKPTEYEWYHGTQAPEFTEFRFGGVKRQTADWNTMLGPHFSDSPGVADMFASGHYTGKKEGGRTIKAQLNINNPKTYKSETDLSDDAVRWAVNKGLLKAEDFTKGGSDARGIGAEVAKTGSVPDWGYGFGGEVLRGAGNRRKRIADGFRKSLAEAGHDGIVYGNNVEGVATSAAIPFTPQQIQMHQTPSVELGAFGGSFPTLRGKAAEEAWRGTEKEPKLRTSVHPYSNVGGTPIREMESPIIRGGEFWRGENPGDIRRISTGNEAWDKNLFLSSDKDSASMYGKNLTRYVAAPDAKILYEGTTEWRKIAGAPRKNESLLDYSARAAEAAKAAGYDAAHFTRQGDVGTAVFNREKFNPSRLLDVEKDLSNAEFIFTGGDAAATGGKLYGSKSMPFETPVSRHGGPGYAESMKGKTVEGAPGASPVWASMKSPMGEIFNIASDVERRGKVPWQVYMTGGKQYLDSSLQMVDTAVQAARAKGVSERANEYLFNVMRSDWNTAADPKRLFPETGLKNEKALREWIENSPQPQRAKLVKAMDSVTARSLGFPDIGQLRVWNTDARMLTAPPGSAGLSMARLEPSLGPVKSHHPSYNTGIAGRDVGTLGMQVPKEIIAPTMHESRMSTLAKPQYYTAAPHLYFPGGGTKALKTEPVTNKLKDILQRWMLDNPGGLAVAGTAGGIGSLVDPSKYEAQ